MTRTSLTRSANHALLSLCARDSFTARGLFGCLFFHYFKFFFLRFDVRIFLNSRGTDKMGRDKNNRELIVGERVFLDPAEAVQYKKVMKGPGMPKDLVRRRQHYVDWMYRPYLLHRPMKVMMRAPPATKIFQQMLLLVCLGLYPMILDK